MEDKQRKTWSRFLTEFGFCSEDPLTENRPCDDGAICDKCEMLWVTETYQRWLKEEE